MLNPAAAARQQQQESRHLAVRFIGCSGCRSLLVVPGHKAPSWRRLSPGRYLCGDCDPEAAPLLRAAE